MRWRRQAWVVLVLAFVVRFGYVCVLGRVGAVPPEYSEQVRIARYLVHGTGFVSPVGPERSDPSSWYVPGYIGLVAGVYALLGEDTFASLATLRVINLLAQATAIALWVAIGRYLLGRRAAALAAMLMVLSPAITFKAAEIWDTFPTMLGGAVCLGTFVLLPLRHGMHYLLAGGLCGVVAMVNPCFTLCYPIWFLWRLQQSHHPSCRRHESPRQPRLSGRPSRGRSFLTQAICLSIGFMAAITPWTIRNRITFGEWFYLRGNLGLEMWVGNAPWPDGYFFSHDGRRIHPVFDRDEADRLVQRGEWAYFHDRMNEVKGWLRESPERFVKLGLHRVRWFWLGRFDLPASPITKIVKFFGVTVPGVLAIVGVIVCLVRRPVCWVLPATLVVFPCVYYITVTMVRYRLPIEPLLLLMAGLVLSEMSRGWPFRRRPTMLSKK